MIENTDSGGWPMMFPVLKGNGQDERPLKRSGRAELAQIDTKPSETREGIPQQSACGNTETRKLSAAECSQKSSNSHIPPALVDSPWPQTATQRFKNSSGVTAGSFGCSSTGPSFISAGMDGDGLARAESSNLAADVVFNAQHSSQNQSVTPGDDLDAADGADFMPNQAMNNYHA
ncbi:MAG: hypothetical protein MHMPM18_004594, partial [Marteilia pararefringens]